MEAGNEIVLGQKDCVLTQLNKDMFLSHLLPPFVLGDITATAAASGAFCVLVRGADGFGVNGATGH